MKPAAAWAKQAVDDLRAAVRAGDASLENGVTARLEQRFRAAQLDTISHCTAECQAVGHTLPRLSRIGSTRCIDALADFAVRVHAEGRTDG